MIGIKLFSNIYFPFVYLKFHLAFIILLQKCVGLKIKMICLLFKLFQKYYSTCAHLATSIISKIVTAKKI